MGLPHTPSCTGGHAAADPAPSPAAGGPPASPAGASEEPGARLGARARESQRQAPAGLEPQGQEGQDCGAAVPSPPALSCSAPGCPLDPAVSSPSPRGPSSLLLPVKDEAGPPRAGLGPAPPHPGPKEGRSSWSRRSPRGGVSLGPCSWVLTPLSRRLPPAHTLPQAGFTLSPASAWPRDTCRAPSSASRAPAAKARLSRSLASRPPSRRPCGPPQQPRWPQRACALQHLLPSPLPSRLCRRLDRIKPLTAAQCPHTPRSRPAPLLGRR